jgi:CelD/BcsL family acetyltransferase involved in cellulose biosynthesis
LKSKEISMPAKYTVKKISDLSEFESLRGEWDQLAEKQGVYAPFLCFDWFKIWLKSFLDAHQLLILLLYEKDRIVGIAPFLASQEKFKSIPVRKIELIGNVYSPTRGFIFTETGPNNKKIYLSKIIDYFFKDFREWDVIDLNPISVEDQNRLIIKSIIDDGKWNISEETSYINWYIEDINYSGNEYLSKRSKDVRHEVKRRRKRLEELGDLEFKVIKGDDKEVEKYIDLYYQVYSSSWKKEERIGPNFHRDLGRLAAEKGWLRLGFLFLNGAPIATQFRIVHKDYCYFLKTAYDDAYKKYGLGTVILSEMIRYLIDYEGVRKIDFGPGDESYKSYWASDKREMKRILVFNKNFKGNCLAIMNNKILPIIRRNGILNQIKTNLTKKNVYKQ